jgi:hypothetical protein
VRGKLDAGGGTLAISSGYGSIHIEKTVSRTGRKIGLLLDFPDFPETPNSTI